MFDDKIMLQNYWNPIARFEDDWDEILRREFGLVEEGEGGNLKREDMWVYEVKKAEVVNSELYERTMAKDRAIAAQMVRLVDKERALAKKEGQEVVRGRKGKPIRERWLK